MITKNYLNCLHWHSFVSRRNQYQVYAETFVHTNNFLPCDWGIERPTTRLEGLSLPPLPLLLDVIVRVFLWLLEGGFVLGLALLLRWLWSSCLLLFVVVVVFEF